MTFAEEILQGRCIGGWSTNETEIERKRELLFSWGYGEEGTKSCPFLLYAQRGFSQSIFVSLHSGKAEGIFS